MLERVRPGRLERPARERRLVRAVLLHRRRALHRERRDDERREEDAGRARQLDDDLVTALRRAALEERRRQVGDLVVMEAAVRRLVVVGRRRILERAGPVVPAVEVVTGGRGVPRRPVMELHAFAQPERPGLAAGQLPLRRERRNDLRGARLQAHEPFEDLFRNGERHTVRNERRIQIRRFADASEYERAGPTGATGSPRHDQDSERSKRQGQLFHEPPHPVSFRSPPLQGGRPSMNRK